MPILLATVLLMSSAAASASEVRSIEEQWDRAYMTGDAALLDQILAPSYRSVGTDGREITKTQLIEKAQDNGRTHRNATSYPLPNTSTIQIYGDLAIVRHHKTLSTEVDVLQKEHGSWKAIFSEATPVFAPGVRPGDAAQSRPPVNVDRDATHKPVSRGGQVSLTDQ